MTSKRRIRVLLSAIAFGGACRSTTDVAPVVTLTVQRDTVTASLRAAGRVDWIDFEIPAAVESADDRSVSFSPCSASLEDVRSGATVWSAICTASTSTGPAPVVVRVTAALSGPGAPKWESDLVPGDYRLRATVLVDSSTTVQAVSNTFAVKAAF